MNKIMIVFFAFFIAVAMPLHAYAYETPILVDVNDELSAAVIHDTMVPIISVDFAFPGGITQDPEDKLGRANLFTNLLTQGAGDLNSTAFQKELNDLSISLSFNAGRDYITGSLVTLKKNKARAFELLKMVLTQPRFEESDVVRKKQSIMAGIRQNQASPSWLMWRNFNDYFYGDHPYTKPGQGTLETVPLITSDDLRLYAGDVFVQNGLLISVAGDVEADEIAHDLRTVFGDLPTGEARPDIMPVPFNKGGDTYHVTLDVPQTFIVMGRSIDIDENDPDWAAAMVANYLIGGGGFSSALMDNVRAEKGLTYGISSSLMTQKYGDVMVVQTSTAHDKVDAMHAGINETLNDVVHNGFDTDKVEAAKAYLVGSMPLSLTSTGAFSGLYLSLQMEGLPLDYLQQREDAIKAVTRDDVQRVATRLIGDMGFVTITVGRDAAVKTSE